MLSKTLTKGQIALLTILLFLLTVGIDFEFQGFYYDETHPTVYLITIASLSLLAIYIIPVTALIQQYRKKWRISLKIWGISFFFGLFSAGWLASYGNDWLAKYFWKSLLSNSLLRDWEAALTAPIVEEFAKILIVFLLLSFFKIWNKKLVFLIGFTVGFGFQIMEDISYILQTSLASKTGDITIAFERIAAGLASHPLYTSVFSIGLYMLLKRPQRLSKFKIFLWILGPIILHFFWNSPLANSIIVERFYILSIVDSILLILLFLDAFTFVNQNE
ncbi:MAG: PrsW family glutamic-type intramembrane protease [Streptococcus sp.]|nr:PrsW family glutamic-type intramembrane protease [Streptococcus sp.]